MHVLEQAQHTLSIDTRGPGFTDLTRRRTAVNEKNIATDTIRARMPRMTARRASPFGMSVRYFTRVTARPAMERMDSDFADPDVLRDLAETLEKLAPRAARYHHAIEGPDDMPAHIRSMLTATSLGVPVTGGKAVLGTWQAIYLIEHRDAPHVREVVLHYVGTRQGLADGATG